ncbi:hypothetical protein CDV31_013700 [Fusarium ambrosium]|uniref:Aminoglycoside phosphotransferase domain-containing protein n=1 Tax=Fusarium ambrosium TaxID=131363 RepID=A0A428T1J9_9HYPO|nr:hypothetical protein CDV31_013700 [Fusarium ambrosium]
MDTDESIEPGIKAPASRIQRVKPKLSAAGRWNAKMLRHLATELEQNPETDICTFLSPRYSKKLRTLKGPAAHLKTASVGAAAPQPCDVRSRLRATDSSTIIFQPSAQMEALLRKDMNLNLSESLVNLLAESEVLYTSDWAAAIMVLKLNNRLVVKITNAEAALTEHRSLTYLQEHLSDFPAPKPHGLIRLGNCYLLFTEFIPGQDLEKVWPQLNSKQKQNITGQLDSLFSHLRSIPHPKSMPLGDVAGYGCKDGRKSIRKSTRSITTNAEFQDFIFSGGFDTISTSYIEFLRGLVPKSPAKIVFTHGDLRRANIMVRRDGDEHGNWRVVAVIDWEASGFYPEYWECIKATNNLTPRDNTDWYQYLPGPISLDTYLTHWLIDRLWDRNMVNS